MHERSYCTYIMASRSRTLYIGVTSNLHQRVFEHKWKERDGFTARYNCDRLVWFENFQFIQKAIAREKELKGWRRAKKLALIESVNPAWMDLSRDWYDCEPRMIGERWIGWMLKSKCRSFTPLRCVQDDNQCGGSREH